MSKLNELAERLAHASEYFTNEGFVDTPAVITEAAALLRQLAELKPVATLRDDSEEELCWEQDAPMLPAGTPLYALPKEWTE